MKKSHVIILSVSLAVLASTAILAVYLRTDKLDFIGG